MTSSGASGFTPMPANCFAISFASATTRSSVILPFNTSFALFSSRRKSTLLTLCRSMVRHTVPASLELGNRHDQIRHAVLRAEALQARKRLHHVAARTSLERLVRIRREAENAEQLRDNDPLVTAQP